MEVVGYCPSPFFTLSIASVHSCQLSLSVGTSGCGKGSGEDVGSSGSWFVSGPGTNAIAYLLL